MPTIDLVIPATSSEPPPLDLAGLRPGTPPLGRLFLLAPKPTGCARDQATLLPTDRPHGAATLGQLLAASTADGLLLLPPDTAVRLGYRAIERILAAASRTRAGLVYGDYVEEKAGRSEPHPTIDFQPGSGRDSFEFGPLLYVARDRIDQALTQCGAPAQELVYGGLYDLWLKVSEASPVLRIPEPLALKVERDTRLTGARQHDYCNPANRARQLEMESVFTAHLKRIGAWLPPRTRRAAPAPATPFPVRATVVIPVRDRERTIGDAVRSALGQRVPFTFNVLVVENHSTDRTRAILAELATRDPKLVVIVPDRTDLGIGGCWDLAIRSHACGRWAVQLDSDDLYGADDALARIVDALEAGPHAMVVGSYRMTDFDLHEIPPGIIDHREWTPENGHNNLLRVNGIGAPRAYAVDVLRTIGFPNVSYGEDYAVATALTRDYQLGRIFEPLYLCRRWEGNTDAALPIETYNRFALYKDHIRSTEIAARRRAADASQER